MSKISNDDSIIKLNEFAHNALSQTLLGDLVIDSLEHFRGQLSSDFGFHNLEDYRSQCEELRDEHIFLTERNKALENDYLNLQRQENRIEERLCKLRDQAEEMRDTLNNVIQSI
tara:strand:+ start:300 stop:641 length:342 start_codon:yes stop_codon:yes gene_type:complete